MLARDRDVPSRPAYFSSAVPGSAEHQVHRVRLLLPGERRSRIILTGSRLRVRVRWALVRRSASWNYSSRRVDPVSGATASSRSGTVLALRTESPERLYSATPHGVVELTSAPSRADQQSLNAHVKIVLNLEIFAPRI